jgi:hypothetical protein
MAGLRRQGAAGVRNTGITAFFPTSDGTVCYASSRHIFPAGSIANSFTSTNNCGYTNHFPATSTNGCRRTDNVATASTISAIPTYDSSSGHLCASHGEGEAPGNCMCSVDVHTTNADAGVLLGPGHFIGKACNTWSPRNAISSDAIHTTRTEAIGEGWRNTKLSGLVVRSAGVLLSLGHHTTTVFYISSLANSNFVNCGDTHNISAVFAAARCATISDIAAMFVSCGHACPISIGCLCRTHPDGSSISFPCDHHGTTNDTSACTPAG